MNRTALKEKARKLVALSLDESGQVSAERVEAVLQALRERRPPAHLPLLRLYLRAIEREERKSRAYVAYAGEPSQEALERIRSELSARYGRGIDVQASENRELIAGLRVRIADDVYDASVAGRLSLLERKLART